MAVKKRWIRVKTEFRGIHNWPECPHEAVWFLKALHRHRFQVEVKMAVEHHDRDIEFFVLQHDIDDAIRYCYDLKANIDGVGVKSIEPLDLGRKSCEEIAEDIHGVLIKKYKRDMIISVSEDGEVAAEIEFDSEEANG